MKAVSFNDKGQPVDPDTGQLLDMPLGLAAALSELRPKPSAKPVEDVVNPLVMPQTQCVEVKQLSKSSSPTSKKQSKYEVGKETVFTIHFGVIEKEDRFVVIRAEDVGLTKGAEPQWVKFRMWTYPEELKWKNEATDFDAGKRIHTLNNDKLNDLKLKNLLLDWSFGTDNIELRLMHVGGFLSDESMKLFFSLYPTIVRHVVDRMNEVLEYNG